MQENPPRRSRRTPPKRGASLPFVPVIVGVVLLGFVIGAGLSVVGRRGADTVAVATSAPIPQATIGDVTAAPEPSSAPSEARASATPRVTAQSSRAPSPQPSVRASATVAAFASPTRAPSPASSPERAATAPSLQTAAPVLRTAEPTPAVAHTAAPTAASEPETAAPALQTAAPPLMTAAPAAPVFDADSDFARLAGNVVRQYLLAIARGDTTSAYAVLSPGPGSGGSTPPELGTVDSTLHIGKIEARGGDAAATVNVDLTTAGGPYYGQYTVHRSATGAALIVSHTFGKP